MTLKRIYKELDVLRSAFDAANSPVQRTGSIEMIWDGAKDDAAVAEAEQRAKLENKWCIVYRVVDPPAKQQVVE